MQITAGRALQYALVFQLQGKAQHHVLSTTAKFHNLAAFDVASQGGRGSMHPFSRPCALPVLNAAAGSQLGVIDTATSSLTRISTGYCSYGKLAVLQSSEGLTVVTVAGSPSKPQALVKLQVRVAQQAVSM
jgi:hypothetical protein